MSNKRQDSISFLKYIQLYFAQEMAEENCDKFKKLNVRNFKTYISLSI